MIRALIFDFDGLILDTETPEFEAWQASYADHGCTLSRETWTQAIGLPWGAFDAYAELEALYGRPIDRTALRTRRMQRFLRGLDALSPLPGVVDYLNDAASLGLRVAVASSSPRTWVEGHLTRLKLRERFPVIRCAEDVPRAKPHPDLYLATLAALDIAPHQAIALEDSPNGITAARAAGIYCVAVPNPMTCDLALDHANLRVSSLAAEPLSRLLAQVAGGV